MASDRSCCYVLTGMLIDSDSDARACAEGAVEKRIILKNELHTLNKGISRDMGSAAEGQDSRAPACQDSTQ